MSCIIQNEMEQRKHAAKIVAYLTPDNINGIQLNTTLNLSTLKNNLLSFLDVVYDDEREKDKKQIFQTIQHLRKKKLYSDEVDFIKEIQALECSFVMKEKENVVNKTKKEQIPFQKISIIRFDLALLYATFESGIYERALKKYS